MASPRGATRLGGRVACGPFGSIPGSKGGRGTVKNLVATVGRWSVVLAGLLTLTPAPAWAQGRTIQITAPSGDVGSNEEFENVANTLQPGDELVLRGGRYSQSGRRAIRVNGTAANPIVIRAATGETAVVTRPGNANFDYPQNNIEIESSSYLIIRGLVFEGGDIGVRFLGANHHVTFEDNEVFNTGNNAIALNSGNSDAIIIRRNHIHHTGRYALGSTEGEGMYVGCNNNTCRVTNSLIEGNYIHHLRATSDGGNDGIEIKVGSGGNVVRDNVIHDTTNGRRYPCIFVYGGGAAPNIVEGNVMWNCGEAIQVAADAVIRNNLILNSDIGITAAPHAQSSQVRNVTIVNNTLAGHGTCLSMGWSSSTGSTLANNAIYCPGGTAVSGSLGSATVRANLVAGGMSSGAVDGTRFTAGGTTAAAFVNAAAMNFWPASGSPLRNAAQASFAPASDFNGRARTAPMDVGAYEADDLAANPGWAVGPGFKSAGGTPAPTTFSLAVVKAGNGGGTVTASGVSCGSDCTESYVSGASVALTATPATGSTFAGWSGAGCTTGTVAMTADRTCTATFTLSTLTLTVTKGGTGTGTVTSMPAGISCGSDCSQTYNHGTAVTLSAAAAAGSTFAGWTGAADCTDGTVTMTAARACVATFTAVTPTLAVTKAGPGHGTIVSSPAGIDCGSDCSQAYAAGTRVTLTVSAAAGSQFAGWSGHADCADGILLADADKACVATFILLVRRPMTREVTPADAWCSVVNAARPGDQIVFTPGTYTTPCVVTVSGTAAEPIVLRGVESGGRRATFQYPGTTHNVLELRDAAFLAIRGFRFAATKSGIDAIRIWRGHDLRVEDNGFDGIGGTSIRASNLDVARLVVSRNTFTALRHAALKLGCPDGVSCTVTEARIEDNAIDGITPAAAGDAAYGIELRRNSSGTLRGNEVTRTRGPGIVVHGAELAAVVVEKNYVEASGIGIVVGGSRVTARNNVVVSNPGGGIVVDAAAPPHDVWIVHNTVVGNGVAGLDVLDWTTPQAAGNVLAYNAVLAAPGAAGLLRTGTTATVVGNVTCESRAACFDAELVPVPGSPLIDAAGSGPEPWRPTDDYTGAPRTGRADVGALEFQP
jgi:hypothetical protein